MIEARVIEAQIIQAKKGPVSRFMGTRSSKTTGKVEIRLILGPQSCPQSSVPFTWASCLGRGVTPLHVIDIHTAIPRTARCILYRYTSPKILQIRATDSLRAEQASVQMSEAPLSCSGAKRGGRSAWSDNWQQQCRGNNGVPCDRAKQITFTTIQLRAMGRAPTSGSNPTALALSVKIQ